MDNLKIKQNEVNDYLLENNTLIYEAMEYNWPLNFEYKTENNNETITGTTVFIDYQRDELRIQKTNGHFQFLSFSSIKKVSRNR
ncbi:YolD-like family protein [Niallia taxi]|uniref:YolD-like family protein n=1 Tax=Niallia taxi TaxID=2499688 RepID=UPI00203F78D8|nr:YolD-like family protein [Niallia taxi]MCM3216728.1 YolD-like family protein [Niallia taxi]